MSDDKTAVVALEEDAMPKNLKRAMRQSKGNVAVAAKLLGQSITKIDNAMRLYNLYAEVKQTDDSQYNGLLTKQIQEDIERKRIIYRSEAMDALYDLATMPIPENSALAQVKLLAAQRLYQETGEGMVGSEIDGTLRSLNDAYHQAAPRIKTIRERTITFSEETQPRLVESSPPE